MQLNLPDAFNWNLLALDREAWLALLLVLPLHEPERAGSINIAGNSPKCAIKENSL